MKWVIPNVFTHPLIGEFVREVDAISADGVPEFSDLLLEPFIKFWKNLIIYRHEPEVADFRVILFSTEIVDSYGEDWTGQLLSESGFTKGFEAIYQVNLKLLNGGERVTDSGSLDWQERNYVRWHEIKMPLRRDGKINEVLVFMCFD